MRRSFQKIKPKAAPRSSTQRAFATHAAIFDEGPVMDLDNEMYSLVAIADDEPGAERSIAIDFRSTNYFGT